MRGATLKVLVTDSHQYPTLRVLYTVERTIVSPSDLSRDTQGQCMHAIHRE